LKFEVVDDERKFLAPPSSVQIDINGQAKIVYCQAFENVPNKNSRLEVVNKKMD
jgi:hypothetical protein